MSNRGDPDGLVKTYIWVRLEEDVKKIYGRESDRKKEKI